jgi:predicted NAD/FAD-dependent oxidoreductase
VTGDDDTRDTVIVGAGVAGLACARALAASGRSVVVLERSRGVGGRCATRRVSGQPVDHGAAFLHGSDDRFLADAGSVPGAVVLPGWPFTIEGTGAPCLPRAFEPLERRIAYAEGMTLFPKHLAAGLDVRLETPVDGISADSGGFLVRSGADVTVRAASVVLAVPSPTARRLLRLPADDGREAAAVDTLLGMIGSQTCLTVLAGYPKGGARPPWDVCYPEDSAIVQMISHDSTKRTTPGFVVLVIQARPCWSLSNFDSDEATWTAGLVQEAARRIGAWAAQPSWVQAHRWRFARSDRGSQLTRPLSVRIRSGGRVIVTGESFAPGGGIEAAWLAGNASAARLMEEE